jgi:hypothetical protein
MILVDEKKICLVSCSVLKQEIEKLVGEGAFDVELVFVDKAFHVEYKLLEENLRQALAQSVAGFPGRVVVVYGDLCLGLDNEMKKLMDEYGVVKVDALNCIDCLLGGKGNYLKADPDHNLLFLDPGMISFFSDFEEKARELTGEEVSDENFAKLFSGLKGIVILDSLGEAAKSKKEVEKLKTGLPILEIRKVGLDNLRKVIQDAIAVSKNRAC